MSELRSRWRAGSVLLGCLLLGMCLALGGCSVTETIGDAIARIFHSDAAIPDPKHGNADPTGLVALFGWLSRTVTILSVVFLIIGAFTRAYPIALPLLGILIGVGLGLAKGIIVEHPYWLYAAYGIGAIVLIAPHCIAAKRGLTAKVTGQPIKGRTGLELLAQVNPFRSNLNGQTSGVRGPVRPAGVAVSSAPAGTSDRGGPGGDGSLGV